MYNLTPESSTLALQAQNALTIVIALIIIFCLLAITLFIKSILSPTKKYTTIVSIVMLLLGLPATVFLAQTKTVLVSKAAVAANIVSLKVTPEVSGKATVDLTTSEPAYVYLEYRDKTSGAIIPVIGKNGLAEKTNHRFELSVAGPAGGEVIIIINGQRLLVNGEPFPIRYER